MRINCMRYEHIGKNDKKEEFESMDECDNEGKGQSRSKLGTIVRFITNPRLLLCVGIAWMITNGWSYVLMAVGTWLKITWMQAVAGAYLAFLWLPVSPEKLVTFAIAILLLKKLFPNDEKTLAVLKRFRQKARDAIDSRKRNRK